MLCHEQSEAEYAIDWERCEKARNQGTSIGSDYPKLSDLDPDAPRWSDELGVWVTKGRPVWTTKDKHYLYPEDMSTEHIVNCIKKLKRDGYSEKQRKYCWVNDKHISYAAIMAIEQENLLIITNPYTLWFEIFYEVLAHRGLHFDGNTAVPLK